MGIKDMIAKWKEKNSKFKEYDEDRKIIEKYEDKKKSANERELERYLKAEREREIKEHLEIYRNKEKELINSRKVLGGKEIFAKEKKVVLNDGSGVLNNKSIMKGGNLFFK